MILRYCWLLSPLLMGAVATPAHGAEDPGSLLGEGAQQTVDTISGKRIILRGEILASGDKQRMLYVEFTGSTVLTASLRNMFSANGFNLVDQRSQADVTLAFNGAYEALRPSTHRTAVINVGEFADHPERLATRSGRGPTFVLSLNPLAALLGTMLHNAGNATGAHDAVNAAVAADPDGKCLARCEGWKYWQHVAIKGSRIVGGKRISEMTVQVEMVADQLLPGELTQTAIAAIASTTASPPHDEAAMDKSEIGW